MSRAFGGRGFGTHPRFFSSGWPEPQGDTGETADPQLIFRAQSCLAQSIGSWVPLTGSLGPATRRALRMFQSQQGLPANGILDSATMVRLQVSCRQGGAAEFEVTGTDYTPQDVIDARYTQAVQRHDTVKYEVVPISIKYDANFDQFAASAAYALREKLYYRSDGGKNARGLVRATGDLQTIHKLYGSFQHPANGAVIQLNAILGRRQDPHPEKRWVMVIRFNDSHGWGFVDVKDPDVIVVDPADVARKAMANVLTNARADCPNLAGSRGKRICEMVTIAERLKYPQNWNLWYYERSIVDEYVNWRTGNARRAEMTKSTGGKVPFDGPATAWGAPWKIYPFRDAAIACSKGGPDCKAIVHNTLVHAEDEMLRTWDDLHKMFSVDSAAIFGPLVESFRQHLVSLQNNPDHLYSAYIKYPN